jgi:hypothetical protein
MKKVGKVILGVMLGAAVGLVLGTVFWLITSALIHAFVIESPVLIFITIPAAIVGVFISGIIGAIKSLNLE